MEDLDKCNWRREWEDLPESHKGVGVCGRYPVVYWVGRGDFLYCLCEKHKDRVIGQFKVDLPTREEAITWQVMKS